MGVGFHSREFGRFQSVGEGAKVSFLQGKELLLICIKQMQSCIRCMTGQTHFTSGMLHSSRWMQLVIYMRLLAFIRTQSPSPSIHPPGSCEEKFCNYNTISWVTYYSVTAYSYYVGVCLFYAVRSVAFSSSNARIWLLCIKEPFICMPRQLRAWPSYILTFQRWLRTSSVWFCFQMRWKCDESFLWMSRQKFRSFVTLQTRSKTGLVVQLSLE